MKHSISIVLAIFALFIPASSQDLTSDVIRERIRTAQAGKQITLTHDAAGQTTKLMGVSDNFSKDEASRAGILAMNFALGFFYPGDSMVRPPESFQLTFWVMSKKPRFSRNHSLTAAMPDEMLVIGSARYTAKAREQMEYLNFEIARENLARIAGQSEVRFMLGDEEFTFTRSQMKLIADMLAVTEAVKNEGEK